MLETAIEDCEQSRFTDFYKQKEKMLNLEVPEYIFSSLFTKEELETIETKFKTNLENENMRYEKGKINFFRLYHLMPEKGKYVHKKNMEEFEQNTHMIKARLLRGKKISYKSIIETEEETKIVYNKFIHGLDIKGTHFSGLEEKAWYIKNVDNFNITEYNVTKGTNKQRKEVTIQPG